MSISKLIEQYVSERPSIKDCLKKGLINYSALSRQIMSDLEIRNFDAVLVACRRYREKLKSYSDAEGRIVDVLSKSTLGIRNRMVAVVLEKGIYYNSLIELQKDVKKARESINIVEGPNAITVVCSSEFLDRIRSIFRGGIIKINKSLAEISLKSPVQIESTPGVTAHVFSLLAEKGVNIVECMSCWTDTFIVINDQDVAKAMAALRL